MHWISWIFGWRQDDTPNDREAFAQREATLRERHERLERMAVEADVIARAEAPEDQPWDER